MIRRASTGEDELHVMTSLIARAAEDEPGSVVPWSMLDDLAALIPAESVSMRELDMIGRARVIQQEVREQQRILERGQEGASPGEYVFFWKHFESFWPTPPPFRAGRVRRWSDRYSGSQLRAQPIYAGTVRKHMEHIFDRTGVRNRGAAIALLMPDARTFRRSVEPR